MTEYFLILILAQTRSDVRSPLQINSISGFKDRVSCEAAGNSFVLKAEGLFAAFVCAANRAERSKR